MIAHALGNPYNLKAVKAFTEKYNLWLIEDCCDALGSEYNGQRVGSFGDVGTLSFYPAHHITMGEGGAVFTNNGQLKKLLNRFVIGEEIVIANLVVIILVVNVFHWQLGDFARRI
jgi:Predicted pyridoxal phosphate-dependent enzyme apparently involved in regulation of cell wall biogenesis